jgi:hypothetical protein
MRRFAVFALLLGCHRDLTVNPCSHNPELCAETAGEGDVSETSTEIDSNADSEGDSVDDTTTSIDSMSSDSSVDTMMMDSSVIADSAGDSTSGDSSTADAPDTCVCVPGETAEGTGTCANVLEKRTKTCTLACAWTPETCALPKGWTPIADAPISGRLYATVIWTGTDVVVYGGGAIGSPAKGDGASYTYATNTWTTLPAPPTAAAARLQHVAVWTRSVMLAWGGAYGSTYRDDGLSYDPITKTWDTLPATTLLPRSWPAATWIPTVKKMFVWGGWNDGTTLMDGALYDPATRTWTMLPSAPISQRYIARAAWTGKEVMVWGGISTTGPMSGAIPMSDGALYDPVANSWRVIPAAPVKGRMNPAMLADSSSLVVFGGMEPGVGWTSDGARLNFATLAWSTVPTVPSSFGVRQNARGWTLGGSLFLWGGTILTGGGTFGYPSDGVALPEGSSAYATIAGTGAPGGRTGFHTVVTPTFAWVWGGQGDPAVVEWPTQGAVFGL